MSRYESRLQRCHDKVYAAFRELQQLRTPPSPDPEPPSAPSPAQPDPSVSAGPILVANTISRNEPITPARQIRLRTPVGQVPDLPIAPETENSEDDDK
jgi:hypothetical protein